MKIYKDGKLNIPSRWTFRIMDEFGFNLEEMADEILDLRTKIKEMEEVHEKEVAALNDEVKKLEYSE